jgi:hypothetical protein
MPTFCRHNRFFAECPICSKGTVLDPSRQQPRRSRASRTGRPGSRGRRTSAPGAASASRGPYASAGPYEGAEMRLERVAGGLRMASWRGGQIERRAPVVIAADLPALVAEAVEKELLPADGVSGDAVAGPQPGAFGSSPGRTGELRDDLRVERLDGERIRIARWILRPNRGWELQEAPVMLPPARFAEALRAAARRGALAIGPPDAALASGDPIP